MEPARARYLACFAYILSRVARADHEVADAESRLMEQIVAERGGLPLEQAALVVRIATTRRPAPRRHRGLHRDARIRRPRRPRAEAGAARLSLRGVRGRPVDPHRGRQRDPPDRQRARLEHADFIAARAAHVEHLRVLKKVDDVRSNWFACPQARRRWSGQRRPPALESRTLPSTRGDDGDRKVGERARSHVALAERLAGPTSGALQARVRSISAYTPAGGER